MKNFVEFNRLISQNIAFTMMVKGIPGSGKTTFLLTLSDDLKDLFDIIYFSTRVNVDVLYNQFPWLKNLEKKVSLIMASQNLLKTLYEKNLKNESKDNIKENAREVISNTNENRMVTKIYYNKYFKMKPVPEIDYIYKKLNEEREKKHIVIIDSIEGLASKYGIDETSIIVSLQEDIFKKTNDIFIYSVETTSHVPLEALSDVIFEFTYEILDSRRIRKLIIDKLRNSYIENPTYLFSLINGKFKILNPNLTLNKEENKFKPLLENDSNFKFPWKEINNILDNGLEGGKSLTLYYGENISYNDYLFVIVPIILNALSNRKLIYIPSPISSKEFYYNTFKKYIDEDIIKNNSYFFDKDIKENMDFSVPLSSNPIDTKITLKNIIEDLMKKNQKMIVIMNSDMLDNLFGSYYSNRTTEFVMDILRMIKIYKVPLINIVKYPEKLTDEIAQMSDYIIKIENIDGNLMLYSLSPSSNYFGFEIDEMEKYPNLKLIPIL